MFTVDKTLWLRDFTMLIYILIFHSLFMENQQTQTESKQEKYILLRFNPDDELLVLAKSVSKKLGMSLSAL